MKKSATAIILLIFALLSPSTNGALYSIAAPRFSSYVDPTHGFLINQPDQNGEISRSTLTNDLLYFSVEIVGGETALKYLEDHQHLKLKITIWGDGRGDVSPVFSSARI